MSSVSLQQPCERLNKGSGDSIYTYRLIPICTTHETTQPELVEGGGAGSVDTFGSGTG